MGLARASFFIKLLSCSSSFQSLYVLILKRNNKEHSIPFPNLPLDNSEGEFINSKRDASKQGLPYMGGRNPDEY